MSGSEFAFFADLLVIQGAGEGPFIQPGDSGAAILREKDGALLGIVFASQHTTEGVPGIAMACPIGNVMDDLRNSGYTFKLLFPNLPTRRRRSTTSK